jgi:hypothetical protein
MLKKIYLSFLALLYLSAISAQELYPFSEPASNMPANSIGLKWGTMLSRGVHSKKIMQRHMPEVMFGLNKEWMVHAGLNFSDMHGQKMIWEGARFYTKYRFLSVDEMHKHFRMAAFAAAVYSRNHLDHNEINMMGDQSAVQAGLIATQLWHKLAISGTGSLVEVLDNTRWSKATPDSFAFRAFNYTISAGYLLFPVQYKDYDQINVNLYAELIGSRNLNFDNEKYFVDLAPSVQFIIKSTGKLNLGYRFELSSDISRISKRGFLISYEHLVLNALKKKTKNPAIN